MIIESTLGYKSSFRVLSLLFETPRRLVSRKELFEFTKLGNSPLSKALARLEKSNIIIKEKKGKKEFYFVNSTNIYTQLLKELWEKEKKDLRFIEYDIKILLSEFIRKLFEIVDFDKIILFGSYAKGTANINSDIDLAIIFKKEITNEIEITRLIKQFNKEIQIHYFTKKSFNEKNSLVKIIKREGIVLM
jgi:uncharacterized protein